MNESLIELKDEPGFLRFFEMPSQNEKRGLVIWLDDDMFEPAHASNRPYSIYDASSHPEVDRNDFKAMLLRGLRGEIFNQPGVGHLLSSEINKHVRALATSRVEMVPERDPPINWVNEWVALEELRNYIIATPYARYFWLLDVMDIDAGPMKAEDFRRWMPKIYWLAHRFPTVHRVKICTTFPSTTLRTIETEAGIPSSGVQIDRWFSLKAPEAIDGLIKEIKTFLHL